ncbi:MAG: amino acid adenylation domain-containing protein, partial [Bacteroidota bacterium]
MKIAKDRDINPQLLDSLRSRKEEIISFLQVEASKLPAGPNGFSKLKPIERKSGDKLPLSYAQERLWFIDQFEGSVQYHQPSVLRIHDELKPEFIEAALKDLVDRHEVLRTIIHAEDGSPYQEARSAEDWKMDYTRMKDGDQINDLKTKIRSIIDVPFDLSSDYMFRAHLIECGPKDFILIMVTHHIASDGWSKSILIKDLMTFYEARLKDEPCALERLSLQYSDYASWERQNIAGNFLASQLNWWEKQLSGIEALELPLDFPRPAVQSTKGDYFGFQISKNLANKIKDFTQKSNVTLFMTILTAFQTLLYRYSGQKNVAIGTPLANRNQQEIEKLVGFFINTMALRTAMDGQLGFSDLVQRMKKSVLASFNHQEVPFAKIVERVEKERSVSRSPVFQAMFSMQNTPEVAKLELGGLQISSQSSGYSSSPYDLSLLATEGAEGIYFVFEYCTDLFHRDTIERMAEHFQMILENVIAYPDRSVDDILMSGKKERQQLLIDFNATAIPYPGKGNFLKAFEEQALQTPLKTAVTFEGKQYTYQQINQMANQLSHYFLEHYQVKREDKVGLKLDRNEWMIIGILAILKAGGAYVPIDPNYPAKRIDFIVQDSKCKLIVDAKELEQFKKERRTKSTENPNIDLLDHQLAYIIYTSGSTGQPKGVMIEHQSLYDYINTFKFHFSLTKEDVVMQQSSISFDISVEEIFPILSTGGTLVIAKETNELESLFAECEQQQVTILSTTPYVLDYLNEVYENYDFSFKALISGGDILKGKYITELYKIFTIYNTYGPTESTVCATYHQVDQLRHSLPIGKAISNRSIYILHPNSNNIQPLGIIGEICIGGVGLSRGYLNQPELTAEKFIRNPFSKNKNTKLYRTGDLGRYLPDGSIEFIGRKDDQIKIRGYRVEIGEIEAALHNCDAIRQCAVVLKSDQDGNKALVAYVAVEDWYKKQVVKEALTEKLPDYMVPAIMIKVDEVPLTSNGKIDKKALPEVNISTLLNKEYVAPRNEVEKQLATIWNKLLKVEQVGMKDDFFELGGHSLMAMRLIASIRKQLKKDLNVKDVFMHPTIESLAEFLHKKEKSITANVITVEERPEKIPLSYTQEHLWFIDQYQGSVQYHQTLALRLKDELDRESLEKAFVDLIERHEVLRTVFTKENGQPYQALIPSENWTLGNWEGPSFQDENDVEAFVQKKIQEPFDLTTDYMLKAHLIKCGEQDHLLVMIIHHIASDGWSHSILFRDLNELFNARLANKKPNLQPIPIQYADYAIWERNHLNTEQLEEKLNWWDKNLQGFTLLELPTDFPRPAIQSTKGNKIGFQIDKATVDQLKAITKDSGATLFMTLLTCLKILLYRYTGQKDICIGTPLANRDYKELENLIGFFINTLTLRSHLGEETNFTDLLKQVKENTLAAFNHKEVPFSKIVDRVVKDRSTSHSPIFQVQFGMQNRVEDSPIELGATEVDGEHIVQSTSLMDLTFSANENPNGLFLLIEYCTDLFTEETIRRMGNHFQILLQSVINDPKACIERLNILSEQEQHQLIVDFNHSSKDFSHRSQTVVGLFEEQVTQRPNDLAVLFND